MAKPEQLIRHDYLNIIFKDQSFEGQDADLDNNELIRKVRASIAIDPETGVEWTLTEWVFANLDRNGHYIKEDLMSLFRDGSLRLIMDFEGASSTYYLGDNESPEMTENELFLDSIRGISVVTQFGEPYDVEWPGMDPQSAFELGGP